MAELNWRRRISEPYGALDGRGNRIERPETLFLPDRELPAVSAFQSTVLAPASTNTYPPTPIARPEDLRTYWTNAWRQSFTLVRTELPGESWRSPGATEMIARDNNKRPYKITSDMRTGTKNIFGGYSHNEAPGVVAPSQRTFWLPGLRDALDVDFGRNLNFAGIDYKRIDFAAHRLHIDMRLARKKGSGENKNTMAPEMYVSPSLWLPFFLHFFALPVVGLPLTNDEVTMLERGGQKARGVMGRFIACPHPIVRVASSDGDAGDRIHITMPLSSYGRDILDRDDGGNLWLFFAKPAVDVQRPTTYFSRALDRAVRIVWRRVRRTGSKALAQQVSVVFDGELESQTTTMDLDRASTLHFMSYGGDDSNVVATLTLTPHDIMLLTTGHHANTSTSSLASFLSTGLVPAAYANVQFPGIPINLESLDEFVHGGATADEYAGPPSDALIRDGSGGITPPLCYFMPFPDVGVAARRDAPPPRAYSAGEASSPVVPTANPAADRIARQQQINEATQREREAIETAQRAQQNAQDAAQNRRHAEEMLDESEKERTRAEAEAQQERERAAETGLRLTEHETEIAELQHRLEEQERAWQNEKVDLEARLAQQNATIAELEEERAAATMEMQILRDNLANAQPQQANVADAATAAENARLSAALVAAKQKSNNRKAEIVALERARAAEKTALAEQYAANVHAQSELNARTIREVEARRDAEFSTLQRDHAEQIREMQEAHAAEIAALRVVNAQPSANAGLDAAVRAMTSSAATMTTEAAKLHGELQQVAAAANEVRTMRERLDQHAKSTAAFAKEVTEILEMGNMIADIMALDIPPLQKQILDLTAQIGTARANGESTAKLAQRIGGLEHEIAAIHKVADQHTLQHKQLIDEHRQIVAAHNDIEKAITGSHNFIMNALGQVHDAVDAIGTTGSRAHADEIHALRQDHAEIKQQIDDIAEQLAGGMPRVRRPANGGEASSAPPPSKGPEPQIIPSPPKAAPDTPQPPKAAPGTSSLPTPKPSRTTSPVDVSPIRPRETRKTDSPRVEIIRGQPDRKPTSPDSSSASESDASGGTPASTRPTPTPQPPTKTRPESQSTSSLSQRIGSLRPISPLRSIEELPDAELIGTEDPIERATKSPDDTSVSSLTDSWDDASQNNDTSLDFSVHSMHDDDATDLAADGSDLEITAHQPAPEPTPPPSPVPVPGRTWQELAGDNLVATFPSPWLRDDLAQRYLNAHPNVRYADPDELFQLAAAGPYRAEMEWRYIVGRAVGIMWGWYNDDDARDASAEAARTLDALLGSLEMSTFVKMFSQAATSLEIDWSILIEHVGDWVWRSRHELAVPWLADVLVGAALAPYALAEHMALDQVVGPGSLINIDIRDEPMTVALEDAQAMTDACAGILDLLVGALRLRISYAEHSMAAFAAVVQRGAIDRVRIATESRQESQEFINLRATEFEQSVNPKTHVPEYYAVGCAIETARKHVDTENMLRLLKIGGTDAINAVIKKHLDYAAPAVGRVPVREYVRARNRDTLSVASIAAYDDAVSAKQHANETIGAMFEMHVKTMLTRATVPAGASVLKFADFVRHVSIIHARAAAGQNVSIADFTALDDRHSFFDDADDGGGVPTTMQSIGDMLAAISEYPDIDIKIWMPEVVYDQTTLLRGVYFGYALYRLVRAAVLSPEKTAAVRKLYKTLVGRDVLTDTGGVSIYYVIIVANACKEFISIVSDTEMAVPPTRRKNLSDLPPDDSPWHLAGFIFRKLERIVPVANTPSIDYNTLIQSIEQAPPVTSSGTVAVTPIDHLPEPYDAAPTEQKVEAENETFLEEIQESFAQGAPAQPPTPAPASPLPHLTDLGARERLHEAMSPPAGVPQKFMELCAAWDAYEHDVYQKWMPHVRNMIAEEGGASEVHVYEETESDGKVYRSAESATMYLEAMEDYQDWVAYALEYQYAAMHYYPRRGPRPLPPNEPRLPPAPPGTVLPLVEKTPPGGRNRRRRQDVQFLPPGAQVQPSRYNETSTTLSRHEPQPTGDRILSKGERIGLAGIKKHVVAPAVPCSASPRPASPPVHTTDYAQRYNAFAEFAATKHNTPVDVLIDDALHAVARMHDGFRVIVSIMLHTHAPTFALGRPTESVFAFGHGVLMEAMSRYASVHGETAAPYVPYVVAADRLAVLMGDEIRMLSGNVKVGRKTTTVSGDTVRAPLLNLIGPDFMPYFVHASAPMVVRMRQWRFILEGWLDGLVALKQTYDDAVAIFTAIQNVRRMVGAARKAVGEDAELIAMLKWTPGSKFELNGVRTSALISPVIADLVRARVSATPEVLAREYLMDLVIDSIRYYIGGVLGVSAAEATLPRSSFFLESLLTESPAHLAGKSPFGALRTRVMVRDRTDMRFVLFDVAQLAVPVAELEKRTRIEVYRVLYRLAVRKRSELPPHLVAANTEEMIAGIEARQQPGHRMSDDFFFAGQAAIGAQRVPEIWRDVIKVCLVFSGFERPAGKSMTPEITRPQSTVAQNEDHAYAMRWINAVPSRVMQNALSATSIPMLTFDDSSVFPMDNVRELLKNIETWSAMSANALGIKNVRNWAPEIAFYIVYMRGVLDGTTARYPKSENHLMVIWSKLTKYAKTATRARDFEIPPPTAFAKVALHAAMSPAFAKTAPPKRALVARKIAHELVGKMEALLQLTSLAHLSHLMSAIAHFVSADVSRVGTMPGAHSAAAPPPQMTRDEEEHVVQDFLDLATSGASPARAVFSELGLAVRKNAGKFLSSREILAIMSPVTTVHALRDLITKDDWTHFDELVTAIAEAILTTPVLQALPGKLPTPLTASVPAIVALWRKNSAAAKKAVGCAIDSNNPMIVCRAFVIRVLLPFLVAPRDRAYDIWRILDQWIEDTRGRAAKLGAQQMVGTSILAMARNAGVPRYFGWPLWMREVAGTMGSPTDVEHGFVECATERIAETTTLEAVQLGEHGKAFIQELMREEEDHMRAVESAIDNAWAGILPTAIREKRGFMRALQDCVGVLRTGVVLDGEWLSEAQLLLAHRCVGDPVTVATEPLDRETESELMSYAIGEMVLFLGPASDATRAYWPPTGVTTAVNAKMATMALAEVAENLSSTRQIKAEMDAVGLFSNFVTVCEQVCATIRETQNSEKPIHHVYNAFAWDLALHYGMYGQDGLALRVMAIRTGTDALWGHEGTPTSTRGMLEFATAGLRAGGSVTPHTPSVIDEVATGINLIDVHAKQLREGASPEELDLLNDIDDIWREHVIAMRRAMHSGLLPLRSYKDISRADMVWFLTGRIAVARLADKTGEEFAPNSSTWRARAFALRDKIFAQAQLAPAEASKPRATGSRGQAQIAFTPVAGARAEPTYDDEREAREAFSMLSAPPMHDRVPHMRASSTHRAPRAGLLWRGAPEETQQRVRFSAKKSGAPFW